VSIPPLTPAGPTAPVKPTEVPKLYVCNPKNQSCQEDTTGAGIPLDQCNLTCNVIPDVPVVLRNRIFRGLQIHAGYMVGEFRLNFTTTNAYITNPKGETVNAVISQTAQYMVLNLENGNKIYSLWQIGEDVVVDFLSWGLGTPNGPPPTSFDVTMTTKGQTTYVFDACSRLSKNCLFL